MQPAQPQVVIGMFAHNEEQNIADTLRELSRQSILRSKDIGRVAIFVLANGCRDNTAHVAASALSEHLPALVANGLAVVVDLPEPGKSRTWNRFVHSIAPASAEYIFFTDADLKFPDETTLADMLAFLGANTTVDVATSRATKTIELQHTWSPINWLSRLGSKLTQSRAQHSIAGSLYCMRAGLAKRITLPIGMLGEDGFVRIAVATDGFRQSPNDNRIQRVHGARHVFQPCQGIISYLKHERRLVLGALQNIAVWNWIRSHDGSTDPQELISRQNALSETWALSVLEQHANELGMPGMFRMAWRRGVDQIRAHSGLKRIALMPIALARIAFSGVAGWMALRAVRSQRVSW